MPVRDARAIYGLPVGATPEDIEAHWQRWGERNGFLLRLSPEEITKLPEGPKVTKEMYADECVWRHERPGKGVPTDLKKMRKALAAYVSEDRWVADCPHCQSGIGCARDMDIACCLGCGRVYPIKFPQHADEIEAGLSKLPPFKRHWWPDEVSA